MKLQEGNLGSLDAVESTPAKNIAALQSARVHVSGTFVADVDIEVSFDQGSTWAVFQQLTAPGLSNELPACGRVRCTASAYTSGTAVCNYAGRNPNLKE